MAVTYVLCCRKSSSSMFFAGKNIKIAEGTKWLWHCQCNPYMWKERGYIVNRFETAQAEAVRFITSISVRVYHDGER